MNRAKRFVMVVACVVAAGIFAPTGSAYATYAKWTSSPVQYYINPQNQDVPADAAEAALQVGASAWGTQSSASIGASYQGRVNDTTTGYDGRNVVLFRNAANPSNGGIVASTYTWYSGETLLDGDIVFWDGAFDFTTTGRGCAGQLYIEDIATHEFGHFFGLLHSGENSATMYPSSTYCSMDVRSLSLDDINGIESLYRPAADAPPAVNILSPANNASVPMGSPTAFVGTAMDTRDGDITANLVWTSNVDGQIGTGGSFNAVLSGGTHTVTAAARDSSGAIGTSSRTVIVAAPCSRGNPVVSLSPVQTWAAAGTLVSYSATVTSTDASSCSSSTFSLLAGVPIGWVGTVQNLSLTLAPGQTGSTTVKATSPAGAAAGAYNVWLNASENLQGRSGSGSAIEDVVSGLSVAVSTNAATYTRGKAVTMTANVLLGLSPAASAKVTFTVRKPDGSVLQSWTPNTNNSGIATQKFNLANNAPYGTYTVTVVATKGSATGTGSTTFVVR